jgi:SAM-dependent methyltransferase
VTGTEQISDWVARHASAFVPGARVLDVACGRGRHSRWLARRGCRVTALDRDREALAGLAGEPGVQVLCCDLEGRPWPLADAARFDVVLVTRYLWRPLWPALLAAVAPGGVWVHETFMAGQERLGRPRRPEFLLRSGELEEVAVAHGFVVREFEQGRFDSPQPAWLQRILAERPC